MAYFWFRPPKKLSLKFKIRQFIPYREFMGWKGTICFLISRSWWYFKLEKVIVFSQAMRIYTPYINQLRNIVRCHAIPTLNTTKAVLYIILYLTGIKRSFFKKGFMCSNIFFPNSLNINAEFCSFWSFCILVSERNA